MFLVYSAIFAVGLGALAGYVLGRESWSFIRPAVPIAYALGVLATLVAGPHYQVPLVVGLIFSALGCAAWMWAQESTFHLRSKPEKFY